MSPFLSIIEEIEEVTAVKRDKDGQPMAKQPRRHEGKEVSSIPVSKLLNPIPMGQIQPTSIGRKPKKSRHRARKPMKRSKKGKLEELSARTEKFDLLSGLAQAATGIAFGQLARVDAEDARKEMRKLFVAPTRRVQRKIAFISSNTPVSRPSSRLSMIDIMTHAYPVRALHDSGSTPNIMSLKLVEKLQLKTSPTARRITVANGSTEEGLGVALEVPMLFGTLSADMDFLILKGAPFDVIVGAPTMESLSTKLDLGRQTAQFTRDGRKATLVLSRGVQNDGGSDEEEFTTDSGTESTEGSPSDEESSESESEEGYVLCIRNDTSEIVKGLERSLLQASGKQCLQQAEAERTNDSFENVDELDNPDGVEIDLPGDPSFDMNVWEKLQHLERGAALEIYANLQDNDVIASSLHDLRPASVPVEHTFELKDMTPIHHRCRRLPPKHNAVVRAELDKMLSAGIIRPSVLQWSFPIVIASKKDGTPRFCVDYRTLNKVMKADRWPIPLIEEILDELKGSSIFSTLDLFTGYWQVQVAEQCKEMTTFICREGTFQFEVMPFGLMNAPATFQRMMTTVLEGIEYAVAYIDDVVIHSSSMAEHITHLRSVLSRVKSYGLKLKLSKCTFARRSVSLLGHIVSEKGVAVDPRKTQALRDTRIPHTKTEVRSFLGLASYYRRFIPHFAEIAKPLHELTSAKSAFLWDKTTQDAFNKLKNLLCSPPVLAYPDFKRHFVVYADASTVAMGAVLTQKGEEQQEHPVCYASRTMNSAEKRYSTYEREALAVVFALKKFRVYLLGTPFILYTDHQALRAAFNSRDPHGRLSRWLAFLAEYDFEIRYHPGRDNVVADFFSRAHVNPTSEKVLKTKGTEAAANKMSNGRQLSVHAATETDRRNETVTAASSSSFEDFLREIMRYLKFQETDPQDKTKMKPFSRALKQQAKNFLVSDGHLIRRTRNGLRAVPPTLIRKGIIHQLHDDFGHWNARTTYQIVAGRFWWPRMRPEVMKHVRECEGCQRASPPIPYRVHLFAPIVRIFETVSVDFAGPLPMTRRGNRYIHIGVEHLTGWPFATAHTGASSGAAVRSLQSFLWQHGVPRIVQSDNGSAYRAQHTQVWAKSQGIAWHFVATYSPQTNGRVERMVGTIKSALRRTLLQDPTLEWNVALDRIIFAYRCRPGPDGVSPFELMYETIPRLGSDRGPGLLMDASTQRSLSIQLTTARRAERHNRMNNLLGLQATPAERIRVGTEPPHLYKTGDMVLLRRSRNRVKSLIESPWKGPFVVHATAHPRYFLRTVGHPRRVSRNSIHFRRLRRYYPTGFEIPIGIESSQ